MRLGVPGHQHPRSEPSAVVPLADLCGGQPVRVVPTATLSLTEEEAAVSSQILQSYLSYLRMEIANPDSWDFREGLKREEIFLKDLIRRLQRSECRETTW